MVISRLVPISISPLGGSDSGEARYSLELHTRLGRRGSDLDHYLDPSLEPRKSAERGEWRPLPPWSPGPTSLPCLGTPLPVFRAPHGGRGGGGRGLLGPEGWRCQFCYHPGGDPLTSASRLLTQRHPPRRRTYRPERAPGTGERTGRLAGGCVRASVRVCVCPCLCVTGAVRRSVRLRVRGRPSVGLSAEPSVPRSLRVHCPIAPPNAPRLRSRRHSCRVCLAPPAPAPPRPRTSLRRSPGIAQGSPAWRGGGGELRHRLRL